jgi:hypothetical protein
MDRRAEAGGQGDLRPARRRAGRLSRAITEITHNGAISRYLAIFTVATALAWAGSPMVRQRPVGPDA